MMAGSGSGSPAVAGGLVRHIPVLGGRAVEFLAVRPGGVYIDATFGAGGFSRALFSDGRSMAITRTSWPAARQCCSNFPGRTAPIGACGGKKPETNRMRSGLIMMAAAWRVDYTTSCQH